MEYGDEIEPPEDDGGPELDTIAGTVEADTSENDDVPVPTDAIEHAINNLPPVKILEHTVPEVLTPSRFLEVIVEHVLDIAPITLHVEARRRHKQPVAVAGVGRLGSARRAHGQLKDSRPGRVDSLP